jgi:phosphatidylglycerophosphate synthase
MTSTTASEPPSIQTQQAGAPKTETLSLYFGRVASRWLTPRLKRLGATANMATTTWGLLGLSNSVVIYLVIRGRLELMPLVPLLYLGVLAFDCVDGDLARALGTANPTGGKLLDGIWHKAIEYSLLVAYVSALDSPRWQGWLLPLGLILVAGEGMYTYAFERRLLMLRVYAKSAEPALEETSDDLFVHGERWGDLSAKRKTKALLGLVQYKSAYFMMLLALLSPLLLFAGLVTLTAYKHYSWIRLVVRTVRRPIPLGSP